MVRAGVCGSQPEGAGADHPGYLAALSLLLLRQLPGRMPGGAWPSVLAGVSIHRTSEGAED